MGDIKKIRKKYEKPSHPWQKDRIDLEKSYKKQFGLTNKKELWKVDTLLKGFKNQIKTFPAMSPEHRAVAEEKLRARLLKYGLIEADTDLGEVLGYDTEVLLSRRLQTVVHKKGLARTPKQARQFITHEHITVNGQTINAPGYLVTIADEANIAFHTRSQFTDEMHPERKQPEKIVAKPKVEAKEEAPEPEVVELKEEDKQLD